jgi:hypothetical protein
MSAGTTARLAWANTAGFPYIRLKNDGTSGTWIRATTLSSGSSEATGFYVSSGTYSHEWQLWPGDKVYVYTTGATHSVQVHVWGELTDSQPTATS